MVKIRVQNERERERQSEEKTRAKNRGLGDGQGLISTSRLGLRRRANTREEIQTGTRNQEETNSTRSEDPDHPPGITPSRLRLVRDFVSPWL